MAGTKFGAVFVAPLSPRSGLWLVNVSVIPYVSSMIIQIMIYT